MAKVCDYCGTTVVRTDRGLQNLGRVAEIANTPSLIAVGDEGTVGGRPFLVAGRLQLDHGKGPWDEYYVSFDHGQAWGWLAYAQGRWYVTQQVQGLVAPSYETLDLEQEVQLAGQPFRVAERKEGSLRSAQGEMPSPAAPGARFRYADLSGPNKAFATIDYGDGYGTPYTVYMGWVFTEPQLQVTQLGPRSIQKVKTTAIKCPSCGGEIPKLSGDRAQRVGCPYCGAISDIATAQVVAQQERELSTPDIPVGARGTFDGLEYVCIANLRRTTNVEGEDYSWQEFLLWAQPVGYRWLVKDPETGWAWTMPVELGELDLAGMPLQVGFGGRTFSQRNEGYAEVGYVLGEVYWQCEVGEHVDVIDFVNGADVLSRELTYGEEVSWSYSTPLAWPVIAQAFNLPLDGAGAVGIPTGGASGSSGGCLSTAITTAVVITVLLICALGACGSCGGIGAASGSGVRGGGVYYGGK